LSKISVVPRQRREGSLDTYPAVYTCHRASHCVVVADRSKRTRSSTNAWPGGMNEYSGLSIGSNRNRNLIVHSILHLAFRMHPCTSRTMTMTMTMTMQMEKRIRDTMRTPKRDPTRKEKIQEGIHRPEKPRNVINHCDTPLSLFRRLLFLALSRKNSCVTKSSGNSNARCSSSGIGLPNAVALRPCLCLLSDACRRCGLL
jgi:hypothetical protein